MARAVGRLMAGHRAQEQLEPGRVGVHGREQIGLAVLGLVLGQAGLEHVREVAPEAVQAPIHHLEDATHVTAGVSQTLA